MSSIELFASSGGEKIATVNATGIHIQRVSVEHPHNAEVDAYHRLRVSQPYTVFDSKHLHDKQPLTWDEKITGSGTSIHVSGHAAIELHTIISGDEIIRQSKRRFNYQPGKGQYILLTMNLRGLQDGIIKTVGIGDHRNGLFFCASGETFGLQRVSNGVTQEVIPQSSFNADTMDGSGVSTITLDFTKTQLLYIDYAWLGVGTVRFGCFVGGRPYLMHSINSANVIETAFITSPNLPVRYAIAQFASVTGYMDHLCTTVISDGGSNPKGLMRSASTRGDHVDANVIGIHYPLLGLRHKDNYQDISIDIEKISVLSETTDDFLWRLSLNPVVSGAGWAANYTDVDAESALQVARGSLAFTIPSGSEGAIISEDFGSVRIQQSVEDIKNAIGLGMTIAGVKDELVLSVMPLSANADIQGAITWREYI